MKKILYTIVFLTLLTIDFGYSQTVYAINSLTTVPSSRYTLSENTEHTIHLSVFIDPKATLNGFKTTLDGKHELIWNLASFNKNEWIKLKHDFKTTTKLENPVLNIEIIDDSSSGTGFGVFFIDDIIIYSNSTLSNADFKNEISIAPNPVENTLVLKNVETYSELILYNILGTEFKVKKNKNGNHFNLDMSNLPSGVYVLKILTENKTVTKKILKK